MEPERSVSALRHLSLKVVSEVTDVGCDDGLGAPMWRVTRALAAALLVLAPPAGAGRWAAAAVIAIVVFAGTWRVRRSVAPEPAHVDQLTGLPDRAAFEAVLDDEIARSRRYQAPL